MKTWRRRPSAGAAAISRATMRDWRASRSLRQIKPAAVGQRDRASGSSGVPASAPRSCAAVSSARRVTQACSACRSVLPLLRNRASSRACAPCALPMQPGAGLQRTRPPALRVDLVGLHAAAVQGRSPGRRRKSWSAPCSGWPRPADRPSGRPSRCVRCLRAAGIARSPAGRCASRAWRAVRGRPAHRPAWSLAQRADIGDEGAAPAPVPGAQRLQLARQAEAPARLLATAGDLEQRAGRQTRQIAPLARCRPCSALSSGTSQLCASLPPFMNRQTSAIGPVELRGARRLRRHRAPGQPGRA